MREKLEEHARVVLLDVDSITPSPYQARKTFSEKEIKKLAVSILQNGLLQPISVRPTIDGRWQLIAGERRLRACKLAGIRTIPAIVSYFEDEKTAALSLLENIQREQLNPFEQARALRELLDLWGCTQEAGARRLGIAQPTLANKLRAFDAYPGPAGVLRGAKPRRAPCPRRAAPAHRRASLESAENGGTARRAGAAYRGFGRARAFRAPKTQAQADGEGCAHFCQHRPARFER